MQALPPAQVRRVFVGLLLGMLAAAMSLTIVSPAMPRIVAELGGMEYYSWIGLSVGLSAAVVVPAVGKLGDLYGRKPFYVGGLVLFMAASLLAGLAQSFWGLVLARVVQGLGMGTVMPLSQAIIADVAPPRERGKFQGLIGTAFGVSSVSGPPLGGWIAQEFSWRWLFFLNVPVGLVALVFIIRFMHLPQVRREQRVDYASFITLMVGLVAVLLATSWGGTQYPWGSPPILGLYGVGTVFLAVFIALQGRSPEPVLPLYLWRDSVFALACIGSMTLAMGMFGAIFYVPVFAQGVLGISVARSGMLLAPMELGLIAVSIVNGFIISRTGHYKPQMLIGLPLMGLGYYLLYRLGVAMTFPLLLLALVLMGAGIGSVMQTLMVVAQNTVPARDLGVATSSVQFFRNVGNTVGIALLGSLMTGSLKVHLPRHMPANLSPEAARWVAEVTSADGVSVLFDPNRLAALPPELTRAVREGLGAAFKPLFAAGLAFAALTFLAAALIKPLPLRSGHAPEPAPANGRARPGSGQGTPRPGAPSGAETPADGPAIPESAAESVRGET